MSMLADRRLRSQLEALVDSDLERGAADQLYVHLRACWSCRLEVHTLRLLKAALADLA